MLGWVRRRPSNFSLNATILFFFSLFLQRVILIFSGFHFRTHLLLEILGCSHEGMWDGSFFSFFLLLFFGHSARTRDSRGHRATGEWFCPSQSPILSTVYSSHSACSYETLVRTVYRKILSPRFFL